MAKRHKNISLKIRKVQEITQQHYEPGNYAKSYYQVWKNYVYPVYPMCYRTYLTYINTRPSELTDPTTQESIKHKEETIVMMREIQNITKRRYRSCDRSQSYKDVWHNFIHPSFRISYRSYMKYVNLSLPELTNNIS